MVGIPKEVEQGSCFPSDLCNSSGILRQKCSFFFFFQNKTSLAASAGGQEVKTRVERGLDTSV